MANIQYNVPYMSIRTLLWIAIAVFYLAWLVSKRHVASSKPKALPFLIAATIALFALRDVWTLVAIINRSKAAYFIQAFAFSVAWGAMLVCSTPALDSLALHSFAVLYRRSIGAK